MATIQDRLITAIALAYPNPMPVCDIMAGFSDPASMSQLLFQHLVAIGERLDLQFSKGEDCVEGFDELVAEVDRLTKAAPWQMHPDYGCVITADVERLDREAETLCVPAPA